MPFAKGWMQIDYDKEITNQGKIVGVGANGQTHEIYGKPVIGFVVQTTLQDTNDGLGTLANYTVVKMNKVVRKLIVIQFSDGFE